MTLFLTLLITWSSSADSLQVSPSHRKLLDAIRQVESGNNPDAVGDNGNAIGAYQIWECYWKDAIEFDPSIGGEYKDCFDVEYSEKVVLAYWKRYATMKRIGRTPTDEDRARIHNGGPNGYKKEATVKYWSKVEVELNG